MCYRIAAFLFLFGLLALAPIASADKKPEGMQSAPSGAASEGMVSLFYTLWSRYAEAVTGGHAEKAADLFTEDAIIMEPNHGDIVGKPAIRKFFADLFAASKFTDVSVAPTETRICGDLIYQLGKFHESAQNHGKPANGYDGRLFALWQRQGDGSWKISRLLRSI